MRREPKTPDETFLAGTLSALASLAALGASARRQTWQHPSIESFVLAEGEFTEIAQPIPVARLGRARECFKNAYNHAEDEGLIYVEGFALPDCIRFPVHHAWCVDQAGNLAEPTWPELGTAYLGIPFAIQFVRKTIVATRVHGVLYTPALDWPLLRNGLTAEDRIGNIF